MAKLEDNGIVAKNSETLGMLGSKPKLIRDFAPGDLESNFRVGDLVWAGMVKNRNKPWCPGQIYNSEDASELALRYRFKDRLFLVAFFDGSSAWCLPSEIKPFVENFEELSRKSSLKSFTMAIQKAVDVVCKVIESSLVCRCVNNCREVSIARVEVAHSGLRKGVYMPEVDVHRLLVNQFQPADLLKKLKTLACNGSAGNLLEVEVLRSWLKAFCGFRGGNRLASYDEAVYIDGLDGKKQEEDAVKFEGAVDNDDWLSSAKSDALVKENRLASYNEAVHIDGLDGKKQEEDAVKFEGPVDNDDWLSSAKSDALVVKDVVYQRKKRTVDDLIDLNSDWTPTDQKTAKVTNKSSQKRKKIADAEVDGERKVKVKESSNGTNSDNNLQEKLENLSSSRQRKRSKYLSPPYIDPADYEPIISYKRRKGKNSKSKDIVIYQRDEVGEQMIMKEALELPKSRRAPKLIKASEKLLAIENGEYMNFSLSDVEAPAYTVISDLAVSAIDHRYLKREGSFDKVLSFVSAFKRSVNLQGLEKGKRELPMQKTPISVKKKVTLGSESVLKICDGNLETNIKGIVEKLDATNSILKNNMLKFSEDEKYNLKNDINEVMEKVESLSEKVKQMVDK